MKNRVLVIVITIVSLCLLNCCAKKEEPKIVYIDNQFVDDLALGLQERLDLEEQIVKMVLSTMSATGDLMLQKDMTFEDAVKRVATKGGITEEGTKVIYEEFPSTIDRLFDKTLEKRRLTTEKAEKEF